MRHDKIKVFDRQAVMLQRDMAGIHHRFHGEFEKLISFHADVVHPFVQRVVTRRIQRAAAGNVELVALPPVRKEVNGFHDALFVLFVGRLQQHRARAVGE